MDNVFPKIAFGSGARALRFNGIEISCYVLSNKNRVFGKHDIHKALGYEGKSENWLHDLLIHIHRFFPIAEILQSYENSYIFESGNGVAGKSVAIDPILFLDICQSIKIAKKEGFLSIAQLKYAKAAEKILDYLNKENISGIIDDASGFKFYKESVIEGFSKFLVTLFNDAAFEWIRTFPEDFFLRIMEANHLDWIDLNENPQVPGRIIHDIIFSRISNDLHKELTETCPKRTYKRKNQLPQDNQHPKLKEYITEVFLILSTAAENWNIFIQLLNRAHPKNTGIHIFPQINDSAKETLTSFDKVIKLMS